MNFQESTTTLKVVLIALRLMDDSLPDELQKRLNRLGWGLDFKLEDELAFELKSIVENYRPLYENCVLVFNIVQADLEEQTQSPSRFKKYLTGSDSMMPIRRSTDLDFFDFAIRILQARDSVAASKIFIAKSEVLSQLWKQVDQYKKAESPKSTVESEMASTDEVMQAYFSTFEEWADVYRNLAKS